MAYVTQLPFLKYMACLAADVMVRIRTQPTSAKVLLYTIIKNPAPSLPLPLLVGRHGIAGYDGYHVEE